MYDEVVSDHFVLGENPLPQKLTFRNDGTFKIVQFTDIHWQNGEEADLKSRALMESILAAEQPDLVVFTGDVVASYGTDNPLQAFRDAVAPVDISGIPWAVVFGNHDTERVVTRREMMELATQYERCLTESGPQDVNGFGNCVLEIADVRNRTSNLLYFFDSGDHSCIPHVKGYDWIRTDQVHWYVRESQKFTAQNGGTPLPAFAFFHIPLPEYQVVWDNEVCYGHKYENVCCPVINSGLFAAMVEMGDVVGTFAGHDHVNDYFGELHDIRLCYGRATGYNTYGREGFARGARMIRLRAGERNFESWIRLEGGSVIEQPEHLPEH